MKSPRSYRYRAALFPGALPAICLMLAAFFAFGGCAAKRVSAKTGYIRALNAWTQSKKIFEGLEARLFITATFKSLPYRDAYVERYSDSYELEETARKGLAERQKAGYDEYNEFFVSVYTPDEKLNDLDSRNSTWKLFLEDGTGARLVPVSITRVEAPEPLTRELFPYFDLWSTAYIVKFPKYSDTGTEPIPGEKTRSLRLVVTGVFGKGELEWRLKD